MHLRRDFQAQGIQPDEAGGVVLVVGLGRVGFHRGNHSLAGARVTFFSSPWSQIFVPAQRKTPAAPSVVPVQAAVAADQECPSRAAALR